MSWRDDVAAQVEGLRGGGSGHARVNCPACPDRVGKLDFKHSLSVNMRNGWWKCHRCDYRGRLAGYGEDGFDDDDGWEDVEDEPEVEEPSDYHALPGRALSLERAREYLAGRGVSEQVMAEAKLGYALKGKHAGRIILPLLDHDDAWLGWVGRGIHQRVFPPSYTAQGMDRRRLFYNQRALTERGPGAALIVTEGPFDALRLWPNAVACMGKPTEDHIERLTICPRPVVVALDGDAWREGLGVARVLRLRGREAYALALPRAEDPGSLPAEVIHAGVAFALKEKSDTDLRSA